MAGNSIIRSFYALVDPEGNDKTVLKYKCHTMKKLSMTRTLLTEKKEGEEDIGLFTPPSEENVAKWSRALT